jgi:hypothetical protein
VDGVTVRAGAPMVYDNGVQPDLFDMCDGGSHVLRVTRENAAGRIGTASVLLAVPDRIPYIYIDQSVWTSRIGRSVVLEGEVAPSALVGRTIVVYVKKPGSSRWTRSSTRTVRFAHEGPEWEYRYTFKRGMRKGVYRFKAVVPARSGFTRSATSRYVSVRLR